MPHHNNTKGGHQKKCCGPKTRVCGKVSVETDPCDKLDVSVKDGCVQVENKPGDSLDVTVNNDCITVSNCDCDPLQVEGEVCIEGGCVQVENKPESSLDVTVQSGCVDVQNKEGGSLDVTVKNDCFLVSNCDCDPLQVEGDVCVHGGCIEVENTPGKSLDVEVTNEKLNVAVCNTVCAITEETLAKGKAAHFESLPTEAIVGEINQYGTITVIDTTDLGCDAFYPKTITIYLPETADADNFQLCVGETGTAGTVALEWSKLECFPGKIEQLSFFSKYRLTVDLEKQFGTQCLNSDSFPLPNGYLITFKFTSFNTETATVCVSGSVRCPQLPHCDFSIPKPECTDGAKSICDDTAVNFDLSTLVTNLDELEPPVEYCWKAISVEPEISGAGSGTGAIVTDVLDHDGSNDTPADVIYEFTVKSSDGQCVSKPCTLTVTVNSPLNVGITGPTGICCGETLVLSATGTKGGGTGPYTYEWKVDGQVESTSETLEIVFPCEGCTGVTGSHQVELVVTSGDGCTGGDQLTVTEFCRPDVSIKAAVCYNESDQLIDATLNACPTGAYYSYEWSVGSTGDPGVNGQTGESIHVTVAGEYCVTVNNDLSGTDGCTGSACFTVDAEC